MWSASYKCVTSNSARQAIAGTIIATLGGWPNGAVKRSTDLGNCGISLLAMQADQKADMAARFLGARTKNCALHKYKTRHARKTRSAHRHVGGNVNSFNRLHLAYGLRAGLRPS